MDLKHRYTASILLHALGDTIGYKNASWEFNYGHKAGPHYSNDLLYEFISLGGIIGIDLKGWLVSDDTIMHMETCKALLEESDDVIKFGDVLARKYIGSFSKMAGRAPGDHTSKMVKLLASGVSWMDLPYNKKAGGSGAAMRTSCIGLVFSGERNRGRLVAFAIEASRITHNYVIGYLGGLVAALFTAYAIEGVGVHKWPYLLIELFESGMVDNYMKKSRGYDTYVRDKDKFIDFWRKYIEIRFNDKKEFIRHKDMWIPAKRSEMYMNNFSLNLTQGPGFMGHDSVIVAYDALADAMDKWETLVVYSMLHFGDSDTTGCIAGGWYGAAYGMKGVPESNLRHLEFKGELIGLAEGLMGG